MLITLILSTINSIILILIQTYNMCRKLNIKWSIRNSITTIVKKEVYCSNMYVDNLTMNYLVILDLIPFFNIIILFLSLIVILSNYFIKNYNEYKD